MYDNDAFYSHEEITKRTYVVTAPECDDSILHDAHRYMQNTKANSPSGDVPISGMSINNALTVSYVATQMGMPRTANKRALCRNVLFYHNPDALYRALNEDFTPYGTHDAVSAWSTPVWQYRFVLAMLVISGQDHNDIVAYIGQNPNKRWDQVLNNSVFYIEHEADRVRISPDGNVTRSLTNRVGAHIFGPYGNWFLSANSNTATLMHDVLMDMLFPEGVDTTYARETVERLCTIDSRAAFDIFASFAYENGTLCKKCTTKDFDDIHAMIETYKFLTEHQNRR